MGPGVAGECVETKDGLHIWEDHFCPEIIDPFTGVVLGDGEQGELVFTSLTKEALPIIRYRTRDLTRLLPGTARPGIRRMEKITGRSDDMIILRGVNLFPTQIEEIVLRIPGLSPHFQLELTRRGRMDQLTVRVEARPDCPAERREAAAARGRQGDQGQRRHDRRGAGRRPGHAGALGGQAAAASRDRQRTVSVDGRARSQRGGAAPGTPWTRCSTSPSRVFNERGYEATSMDELATRLGVTKSAIYHHVPSKGELLRLALDRALDALFAVIEEPGATTGPAIDRLEYVVRGSVRVLAAELPFVTLLLRLRGNTEIERTRWSGGASSTGSSPTWSAPPSTRATCAPTSTPPSPAGCCSAPSTRSSSGTARAATSPPTSSPTPSSPSPSPACAPDPRPDSPRAEGALR